MINASRKWARGLGCILITATIAACSQSASPDGDTDDTILEDIPYLAEVTLPNESRLEFYGSREGDRFDVLVFETSDDHGTSPLEVIAQAAETSEAEVTALEIFWAFSEPGSPVPDVLTDVYGETSLLAQGWARPRLTQTANPEGLETAHANVACDNGNFLSGLINDLNTTNPWFRLDKTPSNYSAFGAYTMAFAPGLLQTRYQFSRSAYAQKWYARVCARSVETDGHRHTVSGTYYGPRVQFERKVGSSWQAIIAPKIIPANTTQLWKVSWDTSSHQSKRFVIDQALPQDQFDMAMD